MTLSEMYATLTEKKPSLAVSMTDDDGAVWRLTRIDPKMKMWVEESDIGKAYLGEKSAAALIFRKWHRELPESVVLRKRVNHGQLVYTVQGWPTSSDCIDAPTDIEALYHFHMEQA